MNLGITNVENNYFAFKNNYIIMRKGMPLYSDVYMRKNLLVKYGDDEDMLKINRFERAIGREPMEN